MWHVQFNNWVCSFTLIFGSDLHFRTSQGIAVAFPSVPDKAIPISNLSPGYISSIKMSEETIVHPPGASKMLGTVTVAAGILISIPGRESLPTVIPLTVTGIRHAVT